MRIIGQLAVGAGVLIIGMTLLLAWWRGRGPSTAMFLVLSRQAIGTIDFDLVQVNADGSDRKVLLGSPAYEITPDWSPDGDSIVYARILGLNASLWRYDLATGTTDMLMDESYDVFGPQFNPAGTQIVASATPNQIRTLVLIDAQTGAVTELATNGRNPAWTPDGDLVYNTAASLWRLSLETNTEVQLLPISSSWRVDFAPDGRWMAVIPAENPYRLLRVGTDGGTMRTIATVNSPNSGPAISPDGQWIWYATDNGVYRVRATGGQPDLMIDSAGSRYRDPSWSPIFDLPYHLYTPLIAGIASAIVGAGLLVLKGNRL